MYPFHAGACKSATHIAWAGHHTNSLLHTYPSPQGLPALPSLKLLVQRLLGRQIQEGAHDSRTDAACSLEVVQVWLCGAGLLAAQAAVLVC